MDSRVKEMWVKALRSGEYSQTTGYLCDSKGYCCLGVLCDLYKKDTGDGTWTLEEEREGFLFTTKDGSKQREVPTKDVDEWAGVSHYTIERDCLEDEDYDGPVGDLIDINDNGHDFKTIANLIEEFM